MHKYLFVLAIILPVLAQAQRGIDNPMTRAVIQAYTKHLESEPDDYEVLLARANEYYNHDEYMRAMHDVDNALKHIPAEKKSERVDAYLLRANIYVQTGHATDALSDLNSAIGLAPTNYVAVYQRGNIQYQLGQYAAAGDDYRRLLALNSRSPEAYIGLARVAVKEQNIGLANEYLDRAVSLDPNKADYYVRRASVRKMMGNHNGAVEDLMLALSTDANNSRATQDLVAYSNTHYAEVMAGLTQAVESAPQVGMFLYLRAVIAQAHYRYKAALADFQRIIDKGLYNYHGIYASMAECRLALAQYDEALAAVNQALSMDANVSAYYVLKSQILRALERNDEAFEVAVKATVVTPGSAVALTELALVRGSQDKWAEAIDLLGEANMEAPNSPAVLLLRAQALQEHGNQPVAAGRFYQQCAELEGFDLDDVKSLRGFALLGMGQPEQAKAWMQSVITGNADPDGLVAYTAACLYSRAGDTETALNYVEKALECGYANKYDWLKNTDGPVTPELLRDNLRFLNLLTRYSHIF